MHSILKVRRLGDTPLLPYRYNTSKWLRRQEILRFEQRTFTMAVTGLTHWSDILLKDGHKCREEGPGSHDYAVEKSADRPPLG